MMLCLLLGVLCGAAWRGHTERSREMAEDFIDAAREAGWALKELAYRLGIHPSDLSHQLDGRDPLNLWRVAELPEPFVAAFLARVGRRRRMTVLTERDVAMLHGAAVMGPKRMAKMLPPVSEQERQVS